MTAPDDIDTSCSLCEGNGPDLSVDDADESTWRCPECGTWSIYYCPDCGDEFEWPCARHIHTEYEAG